MSEYAQGFGDGLREAAKQLRDAANDHKIMASESKKVLDTQAHELAAALFYSWANGFEMNADGFGAIRATPEPPVVRHETPIGDAQATLPVIGAAQAIRNAALEEAAKVAEPVQHDGVPAGARRNIAFAIRALKARETPAATVPDGVIMTPEHKLAVAALVAIRDLSAYFDLPAAVHISGRAARELLAAALDANGVDAKKKWRATAVQDAQDALAAYRATKEGENR